MSSEALHWLVLAAADGGDSSARTLLEEVLPAASDVVAVLVADPELFGSSADVDQRNHILAEIAVQLISGPVLAEWTATPARCAWRFLEERTRELTLRLLDQAWVTRVVTGGDGRALNCMLERLRRLFDRAARKRGLSPADSEDAAQSFLLWLILQDFAALRRWSPTGGRSFDGWFYARALNQISTWRRGRPTSEHAEMTEQIELSEHAPPPDLLAIVRQHLAQIERWLRENCTGHQLEIFRRWFVLEQSAAEIADTLNVKASAVHMVISRLRKAVHAAVAS